MFKFHYCNLALGPYEPRKNGEFSYVDSGRPQWSRKDHGDLTFKQFQAEALTIIRLTKLRWTEFPLHKDLIDKVLEYLYAAHLIDRENRLKIRTTQIAEIERLSSKQLWVFGLEHEIVLDIRNPDMEKTRGDWNWKIPISIALDIDDGIPCPASFRNHFIHWIGDAMEYWTCTEPVCRELKEFDFGESPKPLCVGIMVYFYCKSGGIRMTDLYYSTSVLSKLNCPKIIALYYKDLAEGKYAEF
jgi:hypothetical protein